MLALAVRGVRRSEDSRTSHASHKRRGLWSLCQLPTRSGYWKPLNDWRPRSFCAILSGNPARHPHHTMECPVSTRITSYATVVIGTCTIAMHALSAQTLSFSDQRWQLNGDSTRLEIFDGRQTLRMETGSARRPDVLLQDGTIDVDVMTSRRRSFVYVNFRVESEAEHEEFYLRPHKSQLPDAVQYAPVYQGQSAWQLYYGPRGTASPDLPPNVWRHLRIVLAGRRAAFFLDDTVKPFMVIPHLARESRAGSIELSAFIPPGTPGNGPSLRYANLIVRPDVVGYDFANLPPGP